MTRDEKKKYLHGYQNATIELQKLEDEYFTAFTQATNMVFQITGMPTSKSKSDRLLKSVAKIMDMKERIDKYKKKIRTIDTEISHLRPYHRYMIEEIDIKHVPINVYAKRTGHDEKSLREMRNRVIDKMFLHTEL